MQNKPSIELAVAVCSLVLGVVALPTAAKRMGALALICFIILALLFLTQAPSEMALELLPHGDWPSIRTWTTVFASATVVALWLPVVIKLVAKIATALMILAMLALAFGIVACGASPLLDGVGVAFEAVPSQISRLRELVIQSRAFICPALFGFGTGVVVDAVTWTIDQIQKETNSCSATRR
jgi:hypothetical protein